MTFELLYADCHGWSAATNCCNTIDDSSRFPFDSLHRQSSAISLTLLQPVAPRGVESGHVIGGVELDARTYRESTAACELIREPRNEPWVTVMDKGQHRN
jgi:hypothetical protein